MKEKRTIYIVEKEDGIFKAFDTLAEAKMYILHEYLKWFNTEYFDFDSDEEKLHYFFEDVRNIDENAYVDELFYLHEAEYGGE